MCCLTLTPEARAQAITGYTSIDYDHFSNTIVAYSETVADYDLVGDYNVYVSLYVVDQNNAAVVSRSASDTSGDGRVAVTVHVSATPGNKYTAKGSHKGYANLFGYSDTYPYRIFYYDRWWFGFYEGQGIYQPWFYRFINNGFQEVTRPSQLINLGGTHDTASVTTPDEREEVKWRAARIYEQAALFNAVNGAHLHLANNSHAGGICKKYEIFTLVVSFYLPQDATGLSTARSSVRGIDAGPDAHTNNQDWNINGFSFQNVRLSSTPKTAEMHISMHRRTGGASEAPAIAVRVAGDLPSKPFSTPGNVSITCP